MNIFFIYPSIRLVRTPNHGIAALAGIIREHGDDMDLYHPDRVSDKELLRRFSANNYDLVLVSAVTNQWKYALQMIRAIRKVSSVFIIVGGIHATSHSKLLAETSEIDAICIGEGDAALKLFLERWHLGADYHDIPGMWFRNRKTGAIVENGVGNLIEDLDALPFPDYSIFSHQTICNYPNLMFSRGCPYDCAYCCNNSLRKLYQGKGRYVRYKSVGRALSETKHIVRAYNLQNINFDDDTFIKSKAWLFEFLEGYKNEINIPFAFNTRPETLDDEVCGKIKEANGNIICIGIESGNESLRRRLLKRNLSNDDIRSAFAAARKHGIKTSSFNMVGFPGENYEMHWETVALNRAVCPDWMQITIFYPYEGTELYDISKNNGYLPLKPRSDGNFFLDSILEMDGFSRRRIRFAARTFHFNVYRVRSLSYAIFAFFRVNFFSNTFYLRKFIKSIFEKCGQ